MKKTKSSTHFKAAELAAGAAYLCEAFENRKDISLNFLKLKYGEVIMFDIERTDVRPTRMATVTLDACNGVVVDHEDVSHMTSNITTAIANIADILNIEL